MSEELSSQNEETKKEGELESQELEKAAGGTPAWNKVKNVTDPNSGPH